MSTEDPEPPQPQPQTLAAGELVWAKTKGRHHWWPARLHSPSPSTSESSPLVSSLGADYSDDHRPAAAVKPFLAAPDADALARANTGLAFIAAVANARATAVGILCDALTCPCARDPNPPPPPPPHQDKVVVTTVANLEPREFLAALGSAAVDPPAVGLLDHARLKSWVRALAQGWGPDGPGRYQRRTQAELADKIDLDMLAEDGSAEEEEENKAVPVPHNKTPKQRRRRTKGSHKEEEEEEEDKAVAQKKTPKQMRRAKAPLMESEEEEQEENLSANASSQRKDESGTTLSGRRERKKSKYLSPPYTNIGVFALEDKSPDSPKKSTPTSAANKDERKNSKGSPDEKQQHKKKNKVVPPPLLDNVGAQEVLLLVRCFGEDVSHKRHFPKAAEDFLGLLRSSVFAEGADHDSYKEHDCPVPKNAVADVPVAGLVSDSGAAPKQGKGKRGRKKKDQDGSGGSSVKKNKAEKTSPTDALDSPAANASEKKKEDNVSEKKRGRKKMEQDGTQGSVIKRKKMDKTSPKATLGPGLVITPAIPIRQVSAEDIMNQVKSAGGAGMGAGVPDQKKNNLLVSKSPISAVMSGGVKSGEEQDQGGDGGSVVNAQVNASSDQPEKKNEEGTAQATELDTDMNVDALDGDVSARGAHTDVTMLETDMNVETDINMDTLSGDVPAKSGAQAQVTMPEAGMNVDILNGDVPAGSAQAQVTVPETVGFQVDMNVECVGVVDVPVAVVPTEAMELEANIPVVDINEQVAAVADVPAAASGLLLPMLGDMSQPAAGNKDNASVEARTLQESYTSLIQAMLPEPYKKVEEVAAGTGVIAAPQGEAQKVEQTSQKKAAADGAIFGSHSSAAKGTTNGTPCPDAPSSGQKRRNKKPAAYFANPAEIRVKFKGGTMIPTKEELLSEFRRFGVLVESECDISEERREARVVFGKSTEAEAAYTKAEFPGIFGQFGPPWATLGLNYLEAITLAPPKPPLARADMRKNVENMISSLKNGRSLPLNIGAAFPAAVGGGGAPVSESLLAEMQRLLSKLDKTQPPPGPSGSAPPS